MSYPRILYHFGQSRHISDFVPAGHVSFGLAAGFSRDGLTTGQRDDEMQRTSKPRIETTSIHVGDRSHPPTPLSHLRSLKVGFSIRYPYFIKCFSLDYSEAMYAEVDGDICVELSDVPEFFKRFSAALASQLPGWEACSDYSEYWDPSEVLVGKTQLDLMFLKDSLKYSSQKEYRIVLVPPADFVVTDSKMRQSLFLGPIHDIGSERKKA